MTTLEKMLFTCAACGYRAKIPAHYSGRSIHCPGCRSVQPVGAVVEAGSPATGNTVVLHKVDTVGSGAHAVVGSAALASAPGGSKILFTCPACNYKGKLGAEYDGKTIRCPGCQVAQVVKGSPVPSPIVASLAADEPAFSGNDNEKMRFECTKCSYRARIPAKYAGKPIHCPQCKDVQIAKTETDLEESTGRTVTISRVTPAAVKEARSVGAMTNVGVQFTCAVCGFTSKISPSCAGDAIYCPSCRAPQKVEWGPPAAAAAAAPAASPATGASAATGVSAATGASAAPLDSLNIDLLPLASAPATKPAQVAKPAPRVASAAPVAKVAMPATGPMGPEIEVSDVFTVIKPEPKAAPVVSKHGSRRVISMTPQVDAPAEQLPAAADPAPVAAPSARPAPDANAARKGPPLRRSISESGETAAAEVAEAVGMAKSAPAAKGSAKPARTERPEANDAEPVASRSGGGKLPLVALLLLTFAAGGAAGYFYVKWSEKSDEAAALDIQVKNLTATVTDRDQQVKAAAEAKAVVDAELASIQAQLADTNVALTTAQTDLAEEKRLRAVVEAALAEAAAAAAAGTTPGDGSKPVVPGDGKPVVVPTPKEY